MVQRPSRHPDGWHGANPNYEVPDIVLNDPKNRPLRVITIGAGLSGILTAYKLQTKCENVEHVVYERNPKIGGVWFENRFPGCACDVPAHLYTYPFAPNPDWPRFLAFNTDIREYFDKVVDRCDLRKNIHVNHQIAGCWWQEEKGKWKVKVQKVEPKTDWSSTAPLKVLDEFWDECDLILHCTGNLNRWHLPDLPGLDKFKGRIVHTAGWPEGYGEEDWKKENVAIIGAGATSIQTVTKMQPHVRHMDLFVKSPNWFLPIGGNSGINHDYSDEERRLWRKNPEKLIEEVREMDRELNGSFDYFLLDTPESNGAIQYVTGRMRELFKDDRIFEGMLPDFPVACRRPTPGEPYTVAVQQRNVDVHFTSAASFTEDGVVGQDGKLRKCDSIICATGFDVSFMPQFPIVGRNGVNLQDKWKIAAEAYLSVAVPEFPNWLMMPGPNWPVVQGSVGATLEADITYVVATIHKMQNDLVKSFCVRRDITDEFNEHTQTWAPRTVWGPKCNSWYKDRKTGRLAAVYAGSSLHFLEMLKNPRWEHFELEYMNKENRFAFMGIGKTMAQTEEGREKGMDLSPYLSVEGIDPRMMD